MKPWSLVLELCGGWLLLHTIQLCLKKLNLDILSASPQQRVIDTYSTIIFSHIFV